MRGSPPGAPRGPLHPAPTGTDMHDGSIKIQSDHVYFVADSHFRDGRIPEETERRARFMRFLASIPEDATLFLMGDIFDFYFEYASVVPKRFFNLFKALHDCTGRGVDIHFIGGNHDYWTGSFLPEDLGITVHPDDVLIECQGRRVICAHGDYQMPGERSYKLMRAAMRNPLMIALAKIIHPDLMDAIAARVSSGSKKRKRRTQEQIANYVADMAFDQFFVRGNDAFVMGHVHYPLHRTHAGRDFLILGDWICRFTYAHLIGGRLSLETFEAARVSEA